MNDDSPVLLTSNQHTIKISREFYNEIMLIHEKEKTTVMIFYVQKYLIYS